MKFWTVAALGLSLVAGCTHESDSVGVKPKEGIKEERTESVVATVTAIDQTTRDVTLKGEDGGELSFKASEAVKNLPQVKVGDKVKVNYYRSVAARLRQPGEAVDAPTAVVETAPEGSMPNAFARESKTVSAKILQLDRKASTATIKTNENKTITVNVRDPKNFDKVKVGDELIITYVEGLAVSVENTN